MKKNVTLDKKQKFKAMVHLANINIAALMHYISQLISKQLQSLVRILKEEMPFFTMHFFSMIHQVNYSWQ